MNLPSPELIECAYEAAAHGDLQGLDVTLTRYPSLLKCCEYRRIPRQGRNDIFGWMSLPWALFNARSEDSIYYQQCLNLLDRHGFEPDGHFCDRICREGNVELIDLFCAMFVPDSSRRVSSAEKKPLLCYACGNVSDSVGLSKFLVIARKASDLNVRMGQLKQTALFSLFTSSGTAQPEEATVAQCAAIEWLLNHGARHNIPGFLNGWAHNAGEGEEMPLLHAVAWCQYTDRIHPKILLIAKQTAYLNSRDRFGRDAAQYLAHLESSKAPK